MKYYIIAGEASGDLHAGNLVKNLKVSDKGASFRGFGGEKMAEAGTQITVHYRKMAFMGAFDVLANLGKIKENFKICKNDILDFRPDAVILVDYAGFNLRMAKFCKEHNITTLFYIAPKVWAWNKKRIKKIKAYIDQLYLILPFEKDFFARNGYTATEYIGNPLTDAIARFRQEEVVSREEFLKDNNLTDKPVVALLAGSRKHEIIRLLPEMVKASKNFPGYQFVVAGAPSIHQELYQSVLGNNKIAVVNNQTYQLLTYAHAAVVTSGTATLETALFSVPQVVVYKFNTLSYIILKPFFRIKYFSLVNIILDKPVVKELLQFGLGRKITAELGRILSDKEYFNKMLADYDELIRFIGGPGSSQRAARHIVNFLNKTVA